jgi:environmental stress-induced protein Ves
MRLSVLQPRDYQRTRWKNDGGWTTEIARQPLGDGSGDFRWRVSIADIETDGPFSAFPDIDRDLLLLAGNGIELDINDGAPVRLAQRFQHIRFAGEDAVTCRLLAGPTRDFNVMTRRGTVTADVHARPLNGTMLVFVEPASQWLIHVHAGSVEIRHDSTSLHVQTGATLLLDATGPQRERLVIEGGGELVLVGINEVAQVAMAAVELDLP